MQDFMMYLNVVTDDLYQKIVQKLKKIINLHSTKHSKCKCKRNIDGRLAKRQAFQKLVLLWTNTNVLGDVKNWSDTPMASAYSLMYSGVLFCICG